MHITINHTVEFKKNFDVIVCGGGVSGVAAALSSARCGKKVMLIEKSQKLGGLATLGLINLFVPMCNGRGRQIIFGMAEEFLRLAIKNSYDTIPDDWQNPDTTSRYCTKYSAEIFALELTRLLLDNNVEIMFDSVITDAVYEDGNCKGVVIENKSGRSYYTANMFVEATGDCDLLRIIGLPVNIRGNYHTYIGQQVTLSSCKKAVENSNIKFAVVPISGGGASLYGTNHPKEVKLYDGTDADEVNRYLLANQVEMLEKIEGQDRLTRDIVTLPGMAQFRTTACLDADYLLKGEDAYCHFEDSVGAINDFDRNDYLYEIPYRSLTKKGVKNITAVGRCAGAEGWGWDVLRVIPPAIITGQAAGIAVSQAMDKNSDICNIDVSSLQNELKKQNVMIHFEDEWIPEVSDDTHSNIEEEANK